MLSYSGALGGTTPSIVTPPIPRKRQRGLSSPLPFTAKRLIVVEIDRNNLYTVPSYVASKYSRGGGVGGGRLRSRGWKESQLRYTEFGLCFLLQVVAFLLRRRVRLCALVKIFTHTCCGFDSRSLELLFVWHTVLRTASWNAFLMYGV